MTALTATTATLSGARKRHDSDYGDVAEMFSEMAADSGDPGALRRHRERIFQRCLPLAEHIAHRYSRRGESHDDLVQVACVGLVNAVNRYDVQLGYDFLAFAVPTMMGEVRRYFRDSGWALSVPRRLKELHHRLGVTMSLLSQEWGRAPTPSELAAHLGIDRAEVVEALIAGDTYRATSIEAAAPGEAAGQVVLAERLGERDSALEGVENRESLRPLLAALPERERTIIAMRFFEFSTQTRIAERLGVSQMQVSRLLARALHTLRAGMDGTSAD